MTSRIRIKLGEMEIEYDGEEQFIKEELHGMVSKYAELYKEYCKVIGQKAEENNKGVGSKGNNPSISGTTKTIAAKLDVKSGPDLILAAAAQLTFVANKGTFSRQEIIDAMKAATGHYKKSYLSNLTQYLDQVVKDQKLVETATDQYALKDSYKLTIGDKLAH